jgi:hypothetical protein
MQRIFAGAIVHSGRKYHKAVVSEIRSLRYLQVLDFHVWGWRWDSICPGERNSDCPEFTIFSKYFYSNPSFIYFSRAIL